MESRGVEVSAAVENIVEPLVSIVLPAYNAEHFVARAVGSVLGQSYSNWELIIVDDGSRDDTLDILTRFRDPRIRLYSQENRGVSVARNLGLSCLQGDFFTFLDADDELPPDSLRAQVQEMMRRPELDFLAGQVETRDAGDALVAVWVPEFSGDPLRQFVRLNSRVFFGVCLFVRRDPSLLYAFRDGLTHCEDLLFFVDIASQGACGYGTTPETTYIRRLFSNSAMTNLDGLAKGYRFLFKVVWHLSDPRLSIADKVYLKLRYTRIMFLSYLRAGRLLRALGMTRDLLGLR